jgi:MFS family permease
VYKWLRLTLARFTAEPELLIPMFAAAYGIGCLPLFTLPWLVGSLARDKGYGDSVAGMAATTEVAFLAATTMIVGYHINRLPRRTLAVVGGCLAAVGGVTFASAQSLPTLIPLLAMTGIGCGMCSAAGYSLMSDAKNPARLAANVWIWTGMWTIIVWTVTPLLVGRWPTAGLGAMLVLGCVAFLPLLMRMKGGKRLKRSGPLEAEPASRPNVFSQALLMTCTFIYWLRDSMTWSMADRRGLLLGITEQQLAFTLTCASILGLAGPIAANYLGMRLGRKNSLLGGLILIGLVMQTIAGAESPIAYRLGFMLWTGTSIFAWTYLLEVATALDAQGRVVAICGGLLAAASACGPMLGGTLLQWGGRMALANITGAFTVVTLLAALLLVRRL